MKRPLNWLRIQLKKVLLINKIDLLKNKTELFEFVNSFKEKEIFDSIIPISALKKDGIDIVKREIETLLPENDFFYSSEDFNFQSFEFEISEIIREKVIRYLGDELPYETAVKIEQFEDTKEILNVSALIIVSRSSQKKLSLGLMVKRLSKLALQLEKKSKRL